MKTADYKALLTSILLKKAKGYLYSEKTDEYNVVDGEKQLVKSKVVTKRMQPDVSAVKILLQMDVGCDLSELSDEQLRAEKLRLIALLDNGEQQQE